jgi:hypothetical protein
MNTIHKQLLNKDLNTMNIAKNVGSQTSHAAIGHIICDCSKTPESQNCGHGRQRNSKTAKQFGRYIWLALAPGHREYVARPPPATLNLFGEDECLTLWLRIKKYRQSRIKN